MDFFNNLRNKPYEVRVAAAATITVVAALVLIPLWVWRLKSAGLKPEGANQAAPSAAKVGSPVKSIDEQLKEKFASPVAISKVESDGAELIVDFRAQNNTFADLEFPAAALLARSGSPLYAAADFKKMTDAGGQEFPRLIGRGQTLQGKMYFGKVPNGSYVITLSNLRYSAANQDAFDQTIPIEVNNALSPRS